MPEKIKEKLRVDWYALYGDDFPGGKRDKYFDHWLSKIDEVLEAVMVEVKPEESAFHTRDIIQMSSTGIGLEQNKGWNACLAAIRSNREKL